jgi:hypothetical protein
MTFPLALFVGAPEDTPLGAAFASLPTCGTGAAGVAFFLQCYHHPTPLGLVGQLVSNTPKAPLMQLLISFRANI